MIESICQSCGAVIEGNYCDSCKAKRMKDIKLLAKEIIKDSDIEEFVRW